MPRTAPPRLEKMAPEDRTREFTLPVGTAVELRGASLNALSYMLLAALFLAAFTGTAATAEKQRAAAPALTDKKSGAKSMAEARQILETHCLECHGGKLKRSG